MRNGAIAVVPFAVPAEPEVGLKFGPVLHDLRTVKLHGEVVSHERHGRIDRENVHAIRHI